MKNWGIDFPAVSHVLFPQTIALLKWKHKVYRGNEYILFNFF